MKLVAMKKLRYPRGVDGKEYNAGDEFTALSERDYKALTLVRAAAPAAEKKTAKVHAPAPVVPKTLTAAPAEKQESLLDTPGEDKPMGRRHYLRRDMQADED